MNILIRIKRYDPERDAKPYWAEYRVEADPIDRLRAEHQPKYARSRGAACEAELLQGGDARAAARHVVLRRCAQCVLERHVHGRGRKCLHQGVIGADIGKGVKSVLNVGLQGGDHRAVLNRPRGLPVERQRERAGGDAGLECDVVRDGDAGVDPSPVARDDDRFSARQRRADRLKRLSPHDQRLAHRQPPEPPEVGGQAPRYRIAGADRPVATDGRDQRDDRTAHTATGALMAGQGS